MCDHISQRAPTRTSALRPHFIFDRRPPGAQVRSRPVDGSSISPAGSVATSRPTRPTRSVLSQAKRVERVDDNVAAGGNRTLRSFELRRLRDLLAIHEGPCRCGAGGALASTSRFRAGIASDLLDTGFEMAEIDTLLTLTLSARWTGNSNARPETGIAAAGRKSQSLWAGSLCTPGAQVSDMGDGQGLAFRSKESVNVVVGRRRSGRGTLRPGGCADPGLASVRGRNWFGPSRHGGFGRCHSNLVISSVSC
jgi:hypothetical protein